MNEKFNKIAKVEQLTKMILSRGEEKGLIVKDPLMLYRRHESTKIHHRTWLHVPSGTHWSTSIDSYQVVEIQIETCTKMNTPLLIGLH